ncbi:hypothetical protein PIB30_039277 [Stylosanthes scabra]|uniref:Uncharacterized protein n=1 Tax=Stylosanthes scabra TaxID=79078 RepID=A0ABU6WEA6_9FABA|nr:hypothetical protein [Stylosanthes scabra]
MAAPRGQYWTEVERLEAECNVFLLDRISLVLAMVVSRATCGGVATSPNQWYLCLTMASIATPAYYLLRWLNVKVVSPWGERMLFSVERLLVLFTLVSAPMGSLYFVYSLILCTISLCVGLTYLLCYLDRLFHLPSIIHIFNTYCNTVHDNSKIIVNRAINIMTTTWTKFNEIEEDRDNGKNDQVHINEVEGEKEDVNKEDEEEKEKEGVSEECRMHMMKKEKCVKCCECEAIIMLRNDKWLREMIVDAIVETKKTQQEEERRKWEEEKARLLGKLSAAIATVELYRNLVHDGIPRLENVEKIHIQLTIQQI